MRFGTALALLFFLAYLLHRNGERIPLIQAISDATRATP